MTGEFEGRVAIVTGGSRGIGGAIAEEMVRRGAAVASFDVAAPVEERPGILDLAVDVADASAVGDATAEVLDRLGRLDALFNNAGIQRAAPTHLMDPEVWDLVIGVHLRGAFLCSAAAIPEMRKVGGGAIVSISSAAGFVGIPGRAPYSAAKAGLLGLTRSLAVEAAPHNIRVNAVAPGFTRTPLVQQALDDGSLTEDWMLLEVPLDRLADAAEIARPAVFLASEEASYITGQCIVVDGGWTVQGVSDRPDWLDV
ncbi:MAG: SDR family oxidoreductase [Acidimicrobiia bacterium]|nr:SDR family oxidoreductase [Acidimicrobiia bacterium]MYB24065.1 SDR family oxidoreductase [Acidimicrobiia bacterium]